jgi:pimeloyl-ACP methyl ester carboxylesterase
MNNAARDQMVQRILEQRAMSREDLMAVGRREHPDWPEQELGPWADSKRQHSPNHMAAPRVPWVGFRELVPRIQCPTLLITADPGRGSLVTPAVAEEAAGLNPALRVAHIPDAGHNVRREQFGPYMVAVRAFLSDMDTSRQS